MRAGLLRAAPWQPDNVRIKNIGPPDCRWFDGPMS
jgi:hypothetical protein